MGNSLEGRRWQLRQHWNAICDGGPTDPHQAFSISIFEKWDTVHFPWKLGNMTFQDPWNRGLRIPCVKAFAQGKEWQRCGWHDAQTSPKLTFAKYVRISYNIWKQKCLSISGRNQKLKREKTSGLALLVMPRYMPFPLKLHWAADASSMCMRTVEDRFYLI